VAGAVAGSRSLYSGCGRSRLWRGVPLLAALSLALCAGGCSFSYQLDSFFGGGDSSESTGSVKPAPGAKELAKVSDGDLAYARAAAGEVLKRNEKDASLPWENPASGARGTVTPIASAYHQDGRTCRNFLASYVKGRAEAWLQGEACREAQGPWEVRSLKPWTRS
jgi:surface antigen